jgi:hypothetical protein
VRECKDLKLGPPFKSLYGSRQGLAKVDIAPASVLILLGELLGNVFIGANCSFTVSKI